MADKLTPQERERRTPTEEIQVQLRNARADIERQFEQTRAQFEAANEKIQKKNTWH